MNTCDTCKHWKRNTYTEIQFGICDHPSLELSEEGKIDGLKELFSLPGCLGIQTGEKFGCIHFENKEVISKP
jgi:hypothetical protein